MLYFVHGEIMTKIQWTNETWNFQGGCTPVSEGCLHCAAARSAELCTIRGCKKYVGLTKNGKWTGEIRFFPEELEKPLHWRKPRMIFPAFMSDLFHPSVPFEWIDEVIAIIALCPQHTFQILTKRPERMLEYFISVSKLETESERDMVIWDGWRAVYGEKLNDKIWPLPNLWLGVTCENQKAADERIPILLQIPAAVRFISCEPLLNKVDLKYHLGIPDNHDDLRGLLNWVIVGCESGPERRPCKLKWVRNIRDQCKTAGVKLFVKQLDINGKVEHVITKFPEDLRDYREFPK